MAGLFDASLKELFRLDPGAFARWLGLPADGPIEPVSTDLTALAPVPDTAIRVAGRVRYVLHTEFQSDHDRMLPAPLFTYNAVLHIQTGEVVITVVILLRPAAQARNLTGLYEVRLPGRDAVVTFRYQVIRLWQVPADVLLHGDLALVPLAPLADLGRRSLADMLREAVERIEAAGAVVNKESLWASLLALLDVRYDTVVIRQTIAEVLAMTTTRELPSILADYFARGEQKGREEGREEGVLAEEKSALLNLGRYQFGEPDAATLARFDAITDRDALARLEARFFTAATWADLLTDRPPESTPPAEA